MTGPIDPTVFASCCLALAIAAAGGPMRPRERRVTAPAPGIPTRPLRTVDRWMLRRTRRRPPSARDVAAWCDDIARHVRSGSALRDAVTVLPRDPVCERATTPLRLAIDRGAALGDAITRVDNDGPHLRLAFGVISAASRIGGPAAASIDRTAMVLRQRAADLDERSTQAAQARLSAHVMTAMPLLMLASLIVTDDDVRSAVSSPIGTLCIGTGLALNAIGWWWMRRIVRGPS
jgi:tight adherence protein B